MRQANVPDLRYSRPPFRYRTVDSGRADCVPFLVRSATGAGSAAPKVSELRDRIITSPQRHDATEAAERNRIKGRLHISIDCPPAGGVSAIATLRLDPKHLGTAP